MSPSGSTVLFRALPAKLRLSQEEKSIIRTFARTLSARVANRRPYTCVITDDLELRRLNGVFRGQDYATDVLSFPAPNAMNDLGEMAISIERAKSQAHEFGHGTVDEIQILMLHGVLHLTGMDHESDRGEMAQAERKWRTELGLPATLINRTLDVRSIR